MKSCRMQMEHTYASASESNDVNLCKMNANSSTHTYL